MRCPHSKRLWTFAARFAAVAMTFLSLVSCEAQSEKTRLADEAERVGDKHGRAIAAGLRIADAMWMQEPSSPRIREGDHNQWGRDSKRNNVVADPAIAAKIPTTWHVGEFDDDGNWQREKSKHIKWVARLGTNSYGNPVAANGKIVVGTNNDAGYLARFPKGKTDLGALLCFDERDGSFLWQFSSAKLPGGDKHDWAGIGICSSAMIEGDRVYVVTNRAEVVCLDLEGFRDKENDGPVKDEANTNPDEADVIWRYDMMKELGVEPLWGVNSAVTGDGAYLFVSTSNGADEKATKTAKPDAPAIAVFQKATGKLVFKSEASGPNVLFGQWSSPVLDAQRERLIYTDGDGWLRAIAAGKQISSNEVWRVALEVGTAAGVHGSENAKDIQAITKGVSEMIASRQFWRFDCIPKDFDAGVKPGQGPRNTIIGTPVIHGDSLFVATGHLGEKPETAGELWCVDLTKADTFGGDVSPHLVFNPKHDNGKTPVPPKRELAADVEAGDEIRPNANSAARWKYTGDDLNKNGKLDFEETFHRSASTVAVHHGLVIAPDFVGVVHCVDAATGKAHWTHDLKEGVWGSPLIVGDRVYLGTDHGRIVVFALSKEKKIVAENDVGESIYTTPIVSNGVLYFATKSKLFAVEAK